MALVFLVSSDGGKTSITTVGKCRFGISTIGRCPKK